MMLHRSKEFWEAALCLLVVVALVIWAVSRLVR